MNNVLADANLTGTCGFALERPRPRQTERLRLICRTHASAYKEANSGFIRWWDSPATSVGAGLQINFLLRPPEVSVSLRRGVTHEGRSKFNQTRV